MEKTYAFVLKSHVSEFASSIRPESSGQMVRGGGSYPGSHGSLASDGLGQVSCLCSVLPLGKGGSDLTVLEGQSCGLKEIRRRRHWLGTCRAHSRERQSPLLARASLASELGVGRSWRRSCRFSCALGPVLLTSGLHTRPAPSLDGIRMTMQLPPSSFFAPASCKMQHDSPD